MGSSALRSCDVRCFENYLDDGEEDRHWNPRTLKLGNNSSREPKKTVLSREVIRSRLRSAWTNAGCLCSWMNLWGRPGRAAGFWWRSRRCASQSRGRLLPGSQAPLGAAGAWEGLRFSGSDPYRPSPLQTRPGPVDLVLYSPDLQGTPVKFGG